MPRGPKHGRAHKRSRALLLAATLAAGPPYLCTYCRRPLPADTTRWDLCHDQNGGYRTPPFGHQACNRGAADRYGGRAHPWSHANRAERTRRDDQHDDQRTEPGRRMAARERARQARLRRRLILPTDDEPT